MNEENKVLVDILNDWTECSSVCDLAKTSKLKDVEGLAKADYYMQILPAAEYVKSQTLNYLFSNGITTGSINEDETLDAFLYRLNELGVTNYSVLRNAIGKAITHGSCGLRWYQGDIYQYEPNTYKTITVVNDGIKQIAGYIVSAEHQAIAGFDIGDKIEDYAEIIERLKERKLILLEPTEFINIRNDTSYDYGYSPLLKDELRLDLLVAVYERLNYDIRYDGPGRIIIRPKDGYVAGDQNDISTTEAINQSAMANKKRVDAIKAEAARVAKEIKDSSSDSAIVLSNAFDKEITHLERVTKATEFFDWIENEGVIIAQDFGMSPSLLELGGISGNVSMTSIIDNAMLNSIVPMREHYAIQFSTFLAQHLKITKVFFNKYEMQQAENIHTIRTQMTNMISIMNSIDRPDASALTGELIKMLDEDIHNENGVLEELT